MTNIYKFNDYIYLISIAKENKTVRQYLSENVDIEPIDNRANFNIPWLFNLAVIDL